MTHSEPNDRRLAAQISKHPPANQTSAIVRASHETASTSWRLRTAKKKKKKKAAATPHLQASQSTNQPVPSPETIPRSTFEYKFLQIPITPLLVDLEINHTDQHAETKTLRSRLRTRPQPPDHPTQPEVRPRRAASNARSEDRSRIREAETRPAREDSEEPGRR